MKTIITILLVAASSVCFGAPSTHNTDCAIMGLNAAMWSLHNRTGDQPTVLVNTVYGDYDKLVRDNHITKDRAFDLIGLFLLSKKFADNSPDVSLHKLAKSVELACLASTGKKM